MADMAGPSREQALALLAASNNHGDLYVKLSALKQAKEILLSVEPSLTAELLPYLVELQSSPESLVRKALIEVIEEIGLRKMEYSSVLMPVLLIYLKDNVSTVARQSIIAGTKVFCAVLEELAVQFQLRGRVERWLDELWTWMVKFKDAVFSCIFESRSVGVKLLAIKFLETYILLFTSDSNDSEKSTGEAVKSDGRTFNISWLVDGHPLLDPAALMSEANRSVSILLNFLQSASSLPGSVTVSAVNCLAAVARKRPVYYSSVLSALLDFDPNFVMAKGGHVASIQYSLRTAFLGFLRCSYPTILESRDRLLSVLRAMSAGDAADQVIRQVDKMIKNNERASHDARLCKDEQPPSQQPVSGDLIKKRSTPLDGEEPTNGYDLASKRARYTTNRNTAPVVNFSDCGSDFSVNGVSFKVPLLDSDLPPVEKMIAMIGIFLAEGEKGAKSLEILLSNIQPDLLADIVIANMKHLPNTPPPLSRFVNLPLCQESVSSSGPTPAVAPTVSTVSSLTPVVMGQVLSSSNVIGTSLSDITTSISLPADSKRDPRRDPRRLDPRRLAVSAATPSTPVMEDDINDIQSGAAQSDFDASISLNKPFSLPVVTSSENTAVTLTSKTETDSHILHSHPLASGIDQPSSEKEVPVKEAQEVVPALEVDAESDISLSPSPEVEGDAMAPTSSDIIIIDEAYSPSLEETDELSPADSITALSEETCHGLPVLPLYVVLTEEQQRNERKLILKRAIDSYNRIHGPNCKQACMALLARLVGQIEADDDVVMKIQEDIVSDFQHQKGHELVIHVLYHLHALMTSDSVECSSVAAVTYEKFLLGVAKSLLDTLPATDKSFSRLLAEVPFLPDSALKLLDDICYSNNQSGQGIREGDRVTQGLGALLSLILARPLNRPACLDVALKCAVHSQDDIRTKAIRLVANRLYMLDYISENVEQFAANMILSAVDPCVSDADVSASGATEQRTEWEMGSQEASVSGSQISETGTTEDDCVKGIQPNSRSDSTVSFAQAQCHIALFFALCAKKPRLLKLIFDNYAHAPKAVKQAIHRHIPVLMRALGSSYSDLVQIISNPPRGSENLLTQVLHILSEGTTPSSDLIAIVKHLYETKLKDATILIPMLSSFSKNEVLPIFPRLVDLPLEKFQTALAHILQGSAHTGPALTPVEVLFAIHDINPEKDRLALKKITDACSACFEQRTVFSQQVLAKALNQMVDQTPLPLLFMRTVIQAIDAFPTLVDFVMEILSKLVGRQVWRVPKLWVGFLKCVSQTQPHSFNVLLQLPTPQLESALNKYANLRGPLVTYAKLPSVRTSLPRSTAVVLGLGNELPMPQQHFTSSLHSSDTSSSVHGATPTS